MGRNHLQQKSQSSTCEPELLEIGERWRPFFAAVGVATTGWSPWALYRLAPLIWDHELVRAAQLTLPRDPEYPAMLPDALSAVRILSNEEKQKIQQLVLDSIKGQESKLQEG